MKNILTKNKITEVLKEVIEPQNVDVSSIQQHDTLSPELWEDDKIKQDIRLALLKNSKMFIEYSNLDDISFDDIILTGSMANYNYSKYSDIDLHILFDFSQISENEEFVHEYLKSKRLLWAKNLPVQIKGHDVELYFQDTKEPHHSTGVFSVFKNEWIKKPVKQIIDINRTHIKEKVQQYIDAINNVLSISDQEKFLTEYHNLREKLKKYRKSGLEKNGEYSVENLTFKVLRNMGFLDQLVQKKNEKVTKELSIDEKYLK